MVSLGGWVLSGEPRGKQAEGKHFNRPSQNDTPRSLHSSGWAGLSGQFRFKGGAPRLLLLLGRWPGHTAEKHMDSQLRKIQFSSIILALCWAAALNEASLARGCGRQLFHAEAIFSLQAPLLGSLHPVLAQLVPKSHALSLEPSIFVSGRGQSRNHNEQAYSL